MPDYKVTCCSTADMNEDFFLKRDVPFACFQVHLNGKDYPDDLGKSIPFDKFYQMIKDGAQPTTSQVNQEAYETLFEPILQEGKDILHITLSSGLSGTYNSAILAKKTMIEKYPERRIEVVDSLGASSGYGLLVTKACDMRDDGVHLSDAVNWLNENRLCLHHWFFSTDLTSYYRGGRISKTSALFGTALNICPLLNMNIEGKLIPRSKYRGKRRVMEEIVKRMEEHAKDGLDYSLKCYLSHSACYEDAKIIEDMVENRFKKLDGKVIINSIGTVIGSHTGQGTVALFFWGDKRER